MNENDLLSARGWVQVSLGRFAPPDAPDQVIDARSAARIRRSEDADEASERGSVTYRPTAEQATSPLCAALAAKGACERDVIETLHQEARELRERLMRALETQTPSPAVLAVRAAADLVEARLNARVRDLEAEIRSLRTYDRGDLL